MTGTAEERCGGWRSYEVGAVWRRQGAPCEHSVPGPLDQRLDVVDMVDLGAFVTTSLTNVHLDLVEALDRRADDPATSTHAVHSLTKISCDRRPD